MIDVSSLIAKANARLLAESRCEWSEAGPQQIHNALASAVMEAIAPQWKNDEEQLSSCRQAFYLSAEYLVGRAVSNNLFCLGILQAFTDASRKMGFDPAGFEEIEDAAFGNGGLGRLAACYLDSAASHGIPLSGYGLRYRYGLFRQSIVQCAQHEEPDDWSRFGDPWSVRRESESVIVSMKTGAIRAVPYDLPIVGYRGASIRTLRLWQCESLRPVDFALFNAQKYASASAEKQRAEQITDFLYPNDTQRAGKQMRVKQQYVLVSASVQDMLRRFRRQYGKQYERLPEAFAIQLNDTHPAMAIPELIRILMLDGVAFEKAFDIARDTFSYTNHTVMQEALEQWDLSLLRSVVPDIISVILLMDEKLKREQTLDAPRVGAKHTGLAEPVLSIIRGRRVHMADLSVYGSHATNGVAEIHTGILKRSVFPEWFRRFPDRFLNVTNGITQRRWLGLCNPELTELLCSELGSDSFLTDLEAIGGLRARIDADTDGALARRFIEVKRVKKQQLIAAVEREVNCRLRSDMIFDVQIKRLHEYKRQLMNALSILAIYRELRADRIPLWQPTAFIFGAKAAPGYDRAKSVIRLINQIAALVNDDPKTRDLLQVVFIPNYNCSWAELIIPAADISEQISPAGTEASGTGNMKLMLNGAVTLGTYDGANIEIFEAAGAENNQVFGARVEDLDALRPDYRPRELYEKDLLLHDTLDALTDGTFEDPDGGLAELKRSLLDGASWHKPDPYFVLYDFRPYLLAKIAVNQSYADQIGFARKCLCNIASAGRFSSDRSVREYADRIWRLPR